MTTEITPGVAMHTIVLIGPPGVGKGTQGTVLASAVGMAHITTGDLIVNLEPQTLPPHMALGAKLIGSAAPHGKAPVYLRLVIAARRDAASRAAQKLLALEPERVIFAHGDWFERDGTARLRDAVHWLAR